MPKNKMGAIRWMKMVVLPLTAAIFLGTAGYFAGVHHANLKQNVSVGENAVESLWYHSRILKGLELNKDVAATQLGAMLAERDLAKIMELGSLVKRPEHLEFRASVLRNYKKYRDAHPQLYEFPSYFPDDFRQQWLERQIFIKNYLEENSTSRQQETEITEKK